MYLAYWIYSDEALQGGVTQQRLIRKATDYLCPKRFEDPDEGELAACEFIRFCRGRAWVFTDTGTTKDGENLYQFTHRTFLEYFTAAYLDRTNRTPEKLLKVLLPKIAKQEWDVVAQLAFQLQNKGSEEAGDELLTALIEQAAKVGGDEQWNLLYFAARCLEFIVPSPKITRDITTSCVEQCLAWGTERMGQDTFPKLEDEDTFREVEAVNSNQVEPGEVLGSLLDATTENRTVIADTLEKLLLKKIKTGSEYEALLALEINLHFDDILLTPLIRERRLQREEIFFWKTISERVFSSCSDRVKILCKKSFQLCVSIFWQGQVSISYVVKEYGVNSLFQRRSYILIPKSKTRAIATSLIFRVLFPQSKSQVWKSWEQSLDQLGEVSYSNSHTCEAQSSFLSSAM
jgi:hypothetical protein